MVARGRAADGPAQISYRPDVVQAQAFCSSPAVSRPSGRAPRASCGRRAPSAGRPRAACACPRGGPALAISSPDAPLTVEPLHLLAHDQHLVDAEAALVAGLAAARAARRAGRSAPGRAGPAAGSRCPRARASADCGHHRLLLALGAEAPRQALGQDPGHGAGRQEGLDAHLGEAREGAGGVVGVDAWPARGGR